MLDSIYVGMSGLNGYARGLRVIAHNTANLNTPGFKGATLQFADLFHGDAGSGGIGNGLATHQTVLDFSAGELRQTGQPLDLAVDGQGLFVLRDAQGGLQYTRDGRFRFDRDGVLTSADGREVMGLGADGKLTAIGLAGLRTNAAAATTTVTFTGNLSSTATEQTVGGVRVLDASGGAHELTLVFTNEQDTAAGSWTVTVSEGSTAIGKGTLTFVDGHPVLDTAKLALSFKPTGQPDLAFTLDFSGEVTSYGSGDLSTLAMSKQDGHEAGGLSGIAFDETGALALTYANGQTVKGQRVALARFDSLDAVGQAGDNAFEALDASAWHIGSPGGEFGAVKSGSLEISNVDLSQEFSDLVIMQRGYQASSQIVSTANDMLQELFAMKNK